MAKKDDFNRDVPLPPGLTVTAIQKAIEYIEKPVIVWRVDVLFLIKEDWKYEGSSASAGGGGRTHTFGLKFPAARLKDKAVYQRKDVKLTGGKAVPRNGD